MIRAAFDTSMSTAYFAVEKDGELLLDFSGDAMKGVSELLPEILKKLEEISVKPADINEWLIGIGPGSFTGLRVGLAFAKGIAYVSGAKYRGVNSGYLFHPDEESFTVLHDGRKNEVIINSFKFDGESYEEVEPFIRKIEELQESELTGQTFTVMDVELPAKRRTEFSASAFFKVPLPELTELEEMEKSCEPIYVRPAVFIDPVVPERNHLRRI